MTLHRRLEERLAAFKGTQSAVLFGSGYLANLGVIPALARRGRDRLRRRAQPRRRPRTAAGSRGAEVFAYRHGDVEHLAWGLRNADGRGALIATDGVFSMDGDVAPLEEIVELARAPRRARAGRRRARRRDARARRPRQRGRGRPRRRGRRDRRHAREGVRVLRRLRRLRRRDGALPRQQRAHADVLDRAPARRGRRRDGGARAAGRAAARASSGSPTTPPRCATSSRARASTCRGPRPRSCR